MSGRSYTSSKNFIEILRGQKPRLLSLRSIRGSVVKTHRPSQSRPHSLRGKALFKRDDLQESRNIDIESDKTRSDGRSLRNFCAPPLGSSATEPIGVLEAYGARLLLCRVRAKWRRAALVLRPLWKALSLQASYGFS